MIATSSDYGAHWTVRRGIAAGRLTHIAATDRRWVIAGNPWIFLRSDDDGESWMTQAVAPDAASFPNARTALLGAFNDSTITLAIQDNSVPLSITYRSTDGGKSWKMLQGLGSMAGFVRAMSVSGSTAIAVGRHFVYRSTDRGASWQDKGIGVNTFYSGVEFADSLNGFVMAQDNHNDIDSLGQIRGPWAALDVTTDGGRSWTSHRVFEGWGVNLRSGAYPDRSLAMAVGDSGLAVRSSDGGKSWQRIDLGTKARLDNVSFADSFHGVITGSGTLLRTEDGGHTWQSLDSIGAYALRLATPSPRRVVVATASLDAVWRLYLSTDNGKSWTGHDLHPGVQSIYFIDSLRGWTAGGWKSTSSQGNQLNDVIYTTTDGGQSWSKQLDAAIDMPAGLSDIAFADPLNGFAVGQGDKILRTTDGGLTWNRDPFQLTGTEWFRSVAYPTSKLAFIVTGFGQLLRYTEQPVSRTGTEYEQVDQLNLSAWPNPARSSLQIGFSLATRSTFIIRIINAAGHETVPAIHGIREKGKQAILLDLGGLAAGSYFIELTADGIVSRKLLAVMP